MPTSDLFRYDFANEAATEPKSIALLNNVANLSMLREELTYMRDVEMFKRLEEVIGIMMYKSLWASVGEGKFLMTWDRDFDGWFDPDLQPAGHPDYLRACEELTEKFKKLAYKTYPRPDSLSLTDNPNTQDGQNLNTNS